MMGSLSSSSDARRKRVDFESVINADDRISKLPKDLLLKILTRLTTKEAMRTSVLSTRWENVWKEISHLVLDLRNIARITTLSSAATRRVARSMTKVIKDHTGHLETCTIHYYSYQIEEGMVEAWIQSLIHVKHVKHLTLINFLCPFKPFTKPTTLDLPPKSFSHPNLEYFILCRCYLETPSAFDNCWNLRTLKLASVYAEIGVVNAVLVSCPSLEVLVLDFKCHKRDGLLKIENRNLKLLYLSCYRVDAIEVSSPNLDVLTILNLSCKIENFVIANPRLLQFHRNYWTTGMLNAHTSYSISSPHQETKSNVHELMMSEPRQYMKMCGSLSVSVDLRSLEEVEMFLEVLAAWPRQMEELEIIFKNSSAPMKEAELSTITHTRFWKETKPCPNADLRANTICLSNFSGSREEFALASLLIMQGMVIKSMIIKPLSFSPEIKAAMVKFEEVTKGHAEVSIVMV